MGQKEDPKETQSAALKLATKRTPPESIQKHCTEQRHSPTKERLQPHEESELIKAKKKGAITTQRGKGQVVWECRGQGEEGLCKCQSSREEENQRHSASSGMRMRHSKAMRAHRRHVRREVGVGMRLPADHDEIAGKVAEQNGVLDLRVLCGTGRAEAHVPARGSVERAPCGLNVTPMSLQLFSRA